MGPVGPLDLDEVRLVLSERLQRLPVAPARRRYGAVFVGPTEAARGMAFDVVFIPGLVEKVFPQPVSEDPILLDDARRALPEALAIPLQADRAAAERLALRIAIGAARARVYLSYPRLDVEKGRARVPSFYALEALRAAEGVLPGFETLSERAGQASVSSRLGWPAPDHPADAIDEAEYDLALLAPLLHEPPERTVGTAHYLMGSNRHLARALRFRSARWRDRWTRADGLVLAASTAQEDAEQVEALARDALAANAFAARSWSPTALQGYAACPYRFFLRGIQRLEPRDEPLAPEVLDPLTRGSIFHEVAFRILSALQDENRLPLQEADLATATDLLDRILEEVDAKWRDDLAPAIVRVWEDGVAGVRADLREWLRRSVEEREWTPWRFELSFGLAEGDRGEADSHSRRTPVEMLDGLRLRGSIDLVERAADGRLRATDYKTGKVYGRESLVVQGGEILQPLLYALAAEALCEAPVDGGRLYYCTADGGYKERFVPLDERNRETVRRVIATIGRAVEEGFLPAHPQPDACRYCDYRMLCGPKERERVARKPGDVLRELETMRSMP
jgi:ATP-dependent helicase/DNAse subunit B